MSGKSVRFADPFLQAGFTQLPNAVLRNAELSVPARLTYAMLSSFAWEEERCFPGQEKVAGMLGVTDRTLRDYIGELREAGLVEVERRGLGRSNAYVLLGSGLTGSSVPVKSGGRLPGKKTQVEEDSEEEQQPRSSSSSSQPTSRESLATVWARYVEKMRPRNRDLDAERAAVIRAALKVATAQECREAIEKCFASDWHMKRGQYEGRTGNRFNQLSQILKGRRGKETTRERIDFWLDLEIEGGAVAEDDLDVDQVRREQGLED